MSTNTAQRRLIARYLNAKPVENKIDLHTEFPIAMLRLAGSERTAAFPPFSKNGPPEQPVEGGGTSKRDIPKDHPYDPRSLKPMAKSLWAASVSLGHALTAYRHLSRLKSGTISPDGMLGGRGYVMGIADIRKKLYDACEALSAITDTLHDEITAPHWKPRLAQLDAEEAEDVENYVEESQDILANPEDEAEEEADEIESHKPKAKGADDEDDEKDEDEGSSELPGGGSPPEASAPQPMTPKMANSAWPTGVLPGGPRIVHLDRQDPDPNPPDAYPSDDWGTPTEKEYLYPTPFMGVTVQAESVVPDATTEDTPTEAWDFGLGYGAHGQGAGGYENPSDEGIGNKGVWGPHSGLPGAPPISSGDSTPELDYKTNEHLAQGLLPNDGQPPVARTDYFRGDRGNLINTQSTLPGESTPSGEFAPSLMNTDFTYEDVETPYVRYDYTTHDYRKDPLHAWPQKAEQDKEP